MRRLYTRADFARLAGVSGAAVTKACKGQLAPASVAKRIDVDHPAAVAYLEGHGVSPPVAIHARPEPFAAESPLRDRGDLRDARPSRGAPDQPLDASSEPDIESLADLTLRELIERYGTETQFKDWLDALKKIEDIREKRLKNEETEGRLIERELVKTHVFGAIEASNRRLLGDAPKTIARRVYAQAKSGTTLEEAESTVREIISSQLRPVKATAARVLRDA